MPKLPTLPARRLFPLPGTRFGFGLFCVLTAASVSAQVITPSSGVFASQSLPEYPAITGFEDPNGLIPPASAVTIFDSEYTADYIPAIRTSSDGRVAMRYVGINQERLQFQLFRPEAHSAAMAAAGGSVDPNTSGFVSDFMDLYVVDPDQGVNIVGEGRLRHMALCDGSSLMPGDIANPQVCGEPGNPRDCYDLFAIVSVMGPDNEPARVDLYRVPVRVEVENPKTASARIHTLSAQWDQASTTPALTIDGTTSFFEPVFDRTGRLFVGRLGNALNLANANANEKIDIVYGVSPNDPSLPACDPSTWVGGLKPISHAHHDPVMWIGPVYTGTPRFGIAAYPIRDTEGNVIPDGDDVMATYPWMDREGDNLFFTTVHATLHWQDASQPEQIQTRYPTRGATFPLLGGLVSLDLTDPADRDLFEAVAPQSIEEIGLWPWLYQFEQDSEKRGAATAGLWTQGKMILLDNRLTFSDYGMRPEDPIHRELALYAPRSDPDGTADGYARIGSGTASGWFPMLQQPNLGWYSPPNYPGNPAVIDSLESLFAHHGTLTSGRPRDVVWSVADGDSIADVAFDDWLNPDAFIVSSMMATVTFDGPVSQLAQINRMTYNDGFIETNSLFRGSGWGGEIHLQNAATALPEHWKVPHYGLGDGVRAEPIARGGAEGRGLWLDGFGSLRYQVENQPQDIHARVWYAGIHMDARFDDDGVVRRLLTFPDGSHLALRGLSEILLRRANGENLHNVPIPPELEISVRGWSHLGVRVQPGGREVEVLLDGLPLDRWTCTLPPLLMLQKGRANPRLMKVRVAALQAACPPLFSMEPGEFVVGPTTDEDSGFRGWVDDLRVFAAEPGREVACNHARGTLVRITPEAPPELVQRADAYPAWTHDEIDDALGESESSYLCFREADPSKTSLNSLPDGTESVRTALIFPEAALFAAGAPRPDSSANAFCQTCHSAEGAMGLGLDALIPIGINLENDQRRQPSQSPMRIGGVIPANWLAPGLPPAAIRATGEGYPLDSLLHPAAGP